MVALLPPSGTAGCATPSATPSAATAVGMQPTAVRVQLSQVVFDRPYLMLVTASATGEPLLAARVADPASH